jgi:hypothetical protein
MWDSLLSNPAAPVVAAAVLALFLATAAVLIVRAWLRSRVTPEERERRRRGVLAARGKISDAELVEIHDDLLFYSYLVGGVIYTASQDVGNLHERLPHDYSALSAISVKYDPRNPANSIVVAEQWSGLRAGRAG